MDDQKWSGPIEDPLFTRAEFEAEYKEVIKETMQIKELSELFEAYEQEMKAYDELLDYYNRVSVDQIGAEELYKRQIKSLAS